MNESVNKFIEYYRELQNNLDDTRDTRGKNHELAYVVSTFMFAILRIDGLLNLSKIHRKMQKEAWYISRKLGIEKRECISYHQLRRVLSIIDYEQFNNINKIVLNKEVIHEGLKWESIDGKEQRGTIDKASGKKRGENIVQQVSHQSKESSLIGYYNGAKESEKTVVKSFFKEQCSLQGQAFSFDALHLDAELLDIIEKKKGIYLMQVKENQGLLLEECKHIHDNLPAKSEYSTLDKGHGRIDERIGFTYTLNVESLNKRWSDTGIKSLIAVQRERTIIKTEETSSETAFYISNLKLDEYTGKELFDSVREHWTVETDNYVRDVTMGEDKFHSFKNSITRVVGVAIGTVLNLLRRKNCKNNIQALREDLADYRRKASGCFCGS